MYTVYILYSNTINRYYIGFTEDLEIRLQFHKSDEQSRKFTYKANDWELFFKIDCFSKTQGLAIEKHIKAMKSKIYIQNLSKHPEIAEKLLLKYSDY